MRDTDGTAPVDDLQFLLQSAVRLDVLSALSEGDEVDRYDLEARLDVSRRTIQRTVNAMEARGYLIDSDGQYRLTALGSRLFGWYDAVTTAVAFEEGLPEFLARVPEGTLGFDLSCLSGATVIVETDASPFAALDHILALRREVTRMYELAPLVERRSIQQLADRVTSDENIDVDIILPRTLLEAAETNPEYQDAQATIAAADSVTFHVYPDTPPLGVSVLDETVVLSVGRVDGDRVLVETDDPTVGEWAIDFLDQCRAEATPLSRS